MGKFGKWIAGGVGWAFFGPLGGLIGFAVGSLFDNAEELPAALEGRQTTPGDFAFSLLVLIAAVMKADGKVMRSELDYVKAQLIRIFGIDSANEALQMLKKILNRDIPLEDVTRQISNRLDYSSRLQMLHLLYGISGADGNYTTNELDVIDRIAHGLGISTADRESIRAMFIPRTDAYYKILEIEPSVTDEEVKKAYRKMAVKYHPDKVAHLGEDFRKIANEKFQKVNEAYEKIKNERGIK
ncbi:MAG: TerB family tellurite resistance protein [Bacteroidota bacterium]